MDTMNAQVFRGLLDSAANHLSNRYQEVNALNVFPVPDGDTGTNMNMTFTNGVQEVRKLQSDHVGEIAKILSRGLLMGARGNSGVILSQIFRGFATSVASEETIDVRALADAFLSGKDVAYKAVMRPVEGTILTVLRESTQQASDYITQHPDASVEQYMEQLLSFAKTSLEHTPELLPVLKEVGVVDSGGFGFVLIIEGFVKALQGQPVQAMAVDAESEDAHAQVQLAHEEFGYCTEFIVRLDERLRSHFNETRFREALERLGNSIVMVRDDDLLKVHVHTLKPGDALNLGQRYGEFVKLKIENMSEQHATLIEHAHDPMSPHKTYALVAVASGSGVEAAFKDLRVDAVISGGQTMNPSTEDFVAVVKKLNADHVMIMPNNSNIIMAANQVADVITDKQIHVLSTVSINQGLSACVMFNPEADLETNLAEMNDAINRTRSGSITHAIKDTSIDGITIHEGDFMGIVEKKIVVSSRDLMQVVHETLNQLVHDEAELITLIRGEGIEDSFNQEVLDYIDATYDVETEYIDGHQPVYVYMIGVE